MDVLERDVLSRSPLISDNDQEVFAYASEVMNELLAIHPFREGNGQGFVKVCVTVRDLQSCAWRPADGVRGQPGSYFPWLRLGECAGLSATRGDRGTDVLDVRARPVVMIRVPTLTDHHS